MFGMYDQNPEQFNKKACTKLLLELRTQQVLCNIPTCQNQLYFGDKRGKLQLTNVPTQASPDRLDNENPLYAQGNVQLVCQACQDSPKKRSRPDRITHESGDVVPLLMKDIPEILKILQDRLNSLSKIKRD